MCMSYEGMGRECLSYVHIDAKSFLSQSSSLVGISISLLPQVCEQGNESRKRSHLHPAAHISFHFPRVSLVSGPVGFQRGKGPKGSEGSEQVRKRAAKGVSKKGKQARKS